MKFTEKIYIKNCIKVLQSTRTTLDGYDHCGNTYAKDEAEHIRRRINKLVEILEIDDDKGTKNDRA